MKVDQSPRTVSRITHGMLSHQHEGPGGTASHREVDEHERDQSEPSRAPQASGGARSGPWPKLSQAHVAIVSPPSGPTSAPILSIWGIPLYRDVNLPTGTALAGAWSDGDIYIGSGFRIDVSSEAGSRFDQNITGFRAEEEFGFNAEPYVRTGKFVKILGL